MAARHDHSKLIAGCAILALSLLMHPGLVAQTPAQEPPPKNTKGPDPKDAGSVRKKTPKGKATSLRIAVVDMDRARAGHPHSQKKAAELADWGRKQSANLDRLDKTIQSKKAQLKNTVQPGTEAAEQLSDEIRELSGAYNFRQQRLRERRAAKRAVVLLELQNQVLDAIAELAPKRGIDLVLRRRAYHIRVPLGEQMQRAESTDVLYASATLDITEDVVDFLKTKYPAK